MYIRWRRCAGSAECRRSRDDIYLVFYIRGDTTRCRRHGHYRRSCTAQWGWCAMPHGGVGERSTRDEMGGQRHSGSHLCLQKKRRCFSKREELKGSFDAPMHDEAAVSCGGCADARRRRGQSWGKRKGKWSGRVYNAEQIYHFAVGSAGTTCGGFLYKYPWP